MCWVLLEIFGQNPKLPIPTFKFIDILEAAKLQTPIIYRRVLLGLPVRYFPRTRNFGVICKQSVTLEPLVFAGGYVDSALRTSNLVPYAHKQ